MGFEVKCYHHGLYSCESRFDAVIIHLLRDKLNSNFMVWHIPYHLW